MAGGLFNLVSVGNANVFLTGNPTKTFFKVSYCKYTNFGLQKIRIDYEGARDLRVADESVFTFKVKRIADLLMDTYLVFRLPDIWSPLYHPCAQTNYKWVPYEFRWIRNIGTNLIKEIEITAGSVQIQKYSGAYLQAMMERDFPEEKKKLFDEMTGNTVELNDPANAHGRQSTYPNAYYTDSVTGAEPSIRGRTLYIPLNTWFTLNSRCAFPLIALQYNELQIKITLRPIQELFQVRDVFDTTNLYPYIQPDFNQEQFQMYRFLQTPPAIRIDSTAYQNTLRVWNADIHLLSTYCFLSNDESRMFAIEDQVYLIRDIYEYTFQNVVGSTKLRLLNTASMVASWMWFFRRNDAHMRNEWSNYTNWPYDTLPNNIQFAPSTIPNDINNGITDPNMILTAGPSSNPSDHNNNNNNNTGYYITGIFSSGNHKQILESMGIVLEGDYRENLLDRGVYDYVEKYVRTKGFGKEGLYCYHFCLNTNPFDYQPSGAINMSKFKNIELEITTFIPQIDQNNVIFNVVCDGNQNFISISQKPSWQIYEYSYDMTLFEERYNILSFIGGNCGLMYAK